MATTSKNRNFFEEAARGEKVAKMLAYLAEHAPSPGVEGDTRAANLMASWSLAERACFAQAAGVKAPSVETWGQFLSALMTRSIPVEPAHTEGRDYSNDEWT
jgi:hypothetical protein